MAFPNLGTQQETNRKILEDLQIKKQLLQKGVTSVASNIGGTTSSGSAGSTVIAPNSSPATSVTTEASSSITSNLSSIPSTIPSVIPITTLTVPPTQRSNFNINSSTTLGFFISTDSFFGNTYIPVLPRLDPLPAPATTTPTTNPSQTVTAK